MKWKTALTLAAVALLVSLVANAYLYGTQNAFSAANTRLQQQVIDVQNQVADLSNQTNRVQDEITQLQSRKDSLTAQSGNLRSQVNSLQNENSQLQSEKANLQALLNQASQLGNPARLVTRLGGRDMRFNYSGSDIRLYVSGEVWNVGSGPAMNSRLHVTLYRDGSVVGDTYIELGTIEGASFKEVARNIYYAGGALTRWTIEPEWG